MGKTRKWLRNLLMSRKKHKDKDKGQCGAYGDDQISSSASEIPTQKDKRRWSFRRPPSDSKQLNNSALTNVTAASAAIDAHQNLQNNITYPITEEDTSAAAIKIQSVFRSYLARKALSGLRGIVKLQALVRGQLVRKQVSATLRCMQALLTAQARACAHRIMIASEAKFNQKHSNHTRRTQDISLMISHVYESDETDMESEENIRIVKVDVSGSKENARSRNNTSEQSSPASEKKPPFTSPVSVPNYMANTESSRAKFRSHSAPKQRPETFERQLSRPRASVEARNSGHRPVMKMMRRSSSHAQQHYQYPGSIKLDRSSVSLIPSECGSTSTVLTNTQYCRSLVSYDPHEDRYY